MRSVEILKNYGEWLAMVVEIFFSNPPILDGRNYNYWVIRMKVILGYQAPGNCDKRY